MTKGNLLKTGQRPSGVLGADLAMRGNRHTKKKWDSILPSAKKKLIDDGLFNSDGTITAAGLKKLQTI